MGTVISCTENILVCEKDYYLFKAMFGLLRGEVAQRYCSSSSLDVEAHLVWDGTLAACCDETLNLHDSFRGAQISLVTGMATLPHITTFNITTLFRLSGVVLGCPTGFPMDASEFGFDQ